MPDKPLDAKAYGHIAHLPDSRLGPGDHRITDGQAVIATLKPRDRHDRIIVQEKLDGSCVAVARIGGEIVPLIRAGYRAVSAPREQHKLFHLWAWQNRERFLFVLNDGERIVGEWLAQAHGTRYALPHDPFVAFDIMRGVSRLTHEEFMCRAASDFVTPRVLHEGGPCSISAAMEVAEADSSRHGALDPIEGAVWRVERKGAVDFLCKYVRPDKVDGCYLPELSGKEPVWNWRP